MKDKIGLMILSGCNPLLGVSKKAIEALGKPHSFCLLLNTDKKQLMITPDMSDSFHHLPRLECLRAKSVPLTWDDYKRTVSETYPDFRQMIEEIKVEISPNLDYVETDPLKKRMQLRCFSLSGNESVYYLSYLGLTRGQVLQFKRMQQKLTPDEVGEKAGITAEEYLAYEKDEVDLRETKSKTLFAIARVLQLSAAELIDDYKL